MATALSLPKFGEWLLYLLVPRKDRLKLSADLSRDYKEALVKFGPVAARIDFYGQVGISLWPVIRRVFVRVGGIIGIAKLLPWLLGIVLKSFH